MTMTLDSLGLGAKTVLILESNGITTVDALLALSGAELDALSRIRKYDRERVRERLGAHALALRGEVVAEPKINPNDTVPDEMPDGWRPLGLRKQIDRFDCVVERGLRPTSALWHWFVFDPNDGRKRSGWQASSGRAAQAAEITVRALLAAEKGPVR